MRSWLLPALEKPARAAGHVQDIAFSFHSAAAGNPPNHASNERSAPPFRGEFVKITHHALRGDGRADLDVRLHVQAAPEVPLGQLARQDLHDSMEKIYKEKGVGIQNMEYSMITWNGFFVDRSSCFDRTAVLGRWKHRRRREDTTFLRHDVALARVVDR